MSQESRQPKVSNLLLELFSPSVLLASPILPKLTIRASAFAQFAENYSLIFRATAEEFNPFIDPNHYSAQLLLIHFILIEFQIGYLGLGEAGRRFAYREKSCIAWMEHLAARLPDEYKKYAEWPLNFVRTYLVG